MNLGLAGKRLFVAMAIGSLFWSVSWFLVSGATVHAGGEGNKVSLNLNGRQANAMDYPTVGDDTGIYGMEPVRVEGIGLVMGLRGTGSDPAPSQYRDLLIKIMQQHDVEKPEKMLASDKNAMVILRAFIPPGGRKGDEIDVEAWVPPNDTTTSLAGGTLLESTLHITDTATSKSGKSVALLNGAKLLVAKGPILLNPSGDKEEETATLKKGRLLGGGRLLNDMDFNIVLSREARSGRKTKQLAGRINQRFFVLESGTQVGAAKANDEKKILLKLIKPYIHDPQRFLLVVRRIPISNSDTFQQSLISSLADQLMKQETTLEAALRLEAIGKATVPYLRDGLKSNNTLVRFSSAQALCFLGEVNGVPELERLAEESPVYRPYALSALAALAHPNGRMALMKLLSSESAEARYGAFRSLYVADRRDPAIRGELLGDGFSLHLVKTDATPMVHLARNFRREIVLFGENQALLAPFSLRAGADIVVNASREGGKVYVASFRPSENGVNRRRVECPLTVADVIRAAASVGATYPDLVDLIQQANATRALPGRLEINAIPRTLPLETVESIAIKDEGKADNRRLAPTPAIFANQTSDPGSDRMAVGKLPESENAAKADVVKPKRKFFGLFGN